MLDKTIYELGYELTYRPDWIGLPLRGILAICNGAKDEYLREGSH